MIKTHIEKLLTSHPTPLYVFDIGTLLDRIAYLRRKLPADVSLCYAMKANTFILPHLGGPIDRFEVCSPGELRIFQSLELPSEKLVVSGVVKEPALMEELIASRIPVCAFTVESRQQFDLLRDLSCQYRHRIPILLRLTSGNQFGMNKEEILEIAESHKTWSFLDIRGIQYFSGTQKNSLKRLKREISRLDDFLTELSMKSGLPIRELEFGPGLPVSYFPTDDFDEDAYLEEFSGLLSGMTYKAQITLELGRSIAASCGTYCTRVVDIKTNKGQNYALLDGGIHQLQYDGQIRGMFRPGIRISPEHENEPARKWTVCGSLCTANDILIQNVTLQGLRQGNVLIFENAGAYSAMEGMALFLSHELPKIALYSQAEGWKLIRREKPTYEWNMAKHSGDMSRTF